MMKMMEAKKAELVKEMEELLAEYRNYSGADGETGRAYIYRQLDKTSAKIELLDEMMAEEEK